MIFDKLVLENFGVFKGRQPPLQLTPAEKKPVVLVGGLNGGGKTTILDALNLALYGKRARCSNRGSLAYDDFLRRSIHQSADPEGGARIELLFRHWSDGEEIRYRILRSWYTTPKGVRERLEVLRNDKEDAFLTERWNEYVDGLIPSGIAHLFLFDGEKIEGFADLENSQAVLETAINSLLGLDLVSQLEKDLTLLERRKKTALRPDKERLDIESQEAELEELDATIQRLKDEAGHLKPKIERMENQLQSLEHDLRKEGAHLLEQREQMEKQRDATDQHLQDLEAELREIAMGPAPMTLALELLEDVQSNALREQNAAESAALSELLVERDEKILAAAKTAKASSKLLTALENFLEEDRGERLIAADAPGILNLSPRSREATSALLETVLPEVAQRTQRLLASVGSLRLEREELERKLAAVPERDTVAWLLEMRTSLQAKIQEARTEFHELQAEVTAHQNIRQKKSDKLTKLVDQRVSAVFQQEDLERMLRHASRARDTLDAFRSHVIQRHVSRIQDLVLDSFFLLLRKQSLISSLRIDPETYSLQLFGADRLPLAPDRLSAGERQLLAVSLLWGLARAAGRPLPAVIDTPLGRLDSTHRAHLVQRYFPYASHQVLLLSTDEEIDEEHHHKLKPWIQHSYRLDYSDRTRSTNIHSGYFWD